MFPIYRLFPAKKSLPAEESHDFDIPGPQKAGKSAHSPKEALLENLPFVSCRNQTNFVFAKRFSTTLRVMD